MAWASTSANAGNEVYIKMMAIRVKHQPGNSTAFDASAFYVENMKQQVASVTAPSGTGWTTGISPTSPQCQIAASFTNEWKWLQQRWNDDFSVLWTKVIKISKETGVHAEKKLFRANIPIFKVAKWNDQGNAQDGHIYIYYWCDCCTQNPTLTTIAAADRPALAFTWRLSFTDV